MKPKPLDLEDIRKIFPDDECNPHIRDSYWIPEIKQRIGSACEFYLRYKDKPKLFVKEQRKFLEERYEKDRFAKFLLDSFEHIDFLLKSYYLLEFNAWLFKLTFKGVFKEEMK